MKAVIYTRYGPPEVLHLEEVDIPAVKDNEALIRVRAAEATKADCELRSFRFAVNWFWLPLRLAMGIRKPRNRILGGYFAGEIADTGKDVSGFVKGDPVFGCSGLRFGAYGEYVALPADTTLATKPTNMTFEEAAAVPLGGLNALHFLRLANIRPGEKALINGAGGSIGAHGVQIAKAFGAEVTAVDASHKEAFVRRLGADHFIDYQREDFSQNAGHYDVIFDMVPTSSYGACMRALAADGRYMTGNPRLSVMLRILLTNWFTRKRASFAFAKETIEELETLRDMIEAGQIGPIIDRVLPMEQASEAHHLVETEQRIGAIVLAMSEKDSEQP